jgi:hypothetical protein
LHLITLNKTHAHARTRARAVRHPWTRGFGPLPAHQTISRRARQARSPCNW